jgi:hypothetical protein
MSLATARQIYGSIHLQAKNCKLLAVFTHAQKTQNLYLNNIQKLYLTKIYFYLPIAEILKILANGPLC